MPAAPNTAAPVRYGSAFDDLENSVAIAYVERLGSDISIGGTVRCRMRACTAAAGSYD